MEYSSEILKRAPRKYQLFDIITRLNTLKDTTKAPAVDLMMKENRVCNLLKHRLFHMGEPPSQSRLYELIIYSWQSFVGH